MGSKIIMTNKGWVTFLIGFTIGILAWPLMSYLLNISIKK